MNPLTAILRLCCLLSPKSIAQTQIETHLLIFLDTLSSHVGLCKLLKATPALTELGEFVARSDTTGDAEKVYARKLALRKRLDRFRVL